MIDRRLGEGWFLAGDIGGTNTRLGLFTKHDDRPKLMRFSSFLNREYENFPELLKKFLKKKSPKIESACIGAAGPVLGGRAEVTQLPWILDSEQISRSARIPAVELVNDLVATGEGLAWLLPEQLETIQRGASSPPKGNAVLVAPGTGLGVALMIRCGTELRPFPSEAGHVDFAPRTHREVALLNFLRRRFGRVSVERVVSGPGLVAIYEFLRQTGSPSELQEDLPCLKAADPAAAISEAALAGRCALCRSALHLFVELLGAVVGNLALTNLALGGVFLGGGIPPKILPALRHRRFLAGFLEKGRFRQLLTTIPVKVILEENTAILGAAVRAMRVD